MPARWRKRADQKKKRKGKTHSGKYSYAERKAMARENYLSHLESLAYHLFLNNNVTYYSDVADKLKIGLKLAVEVCHRLVEKGKIKPRTKEEAEKK